MQNNSNIEISFDTLKNDVLRGASKENRDTFVNYVKLFVKKNNWFQVDKITRFIKTYNKIFPDDEDGEILFGVLKFFLDTVLMQNYDTKVDNVYDLLDGFKNELSWEQSCGLLIDFLDKDWDRNQNNKNPENAKKIVNNLLSYLEKSEAKKIYEDESKFGCVKKYFTKIMTDVPEIKTSEYLSYISKKLAETNLPPQFCFEAVLSFGDKILLQTDVKNLGWHAQFARFRSNIIQIVEEDNSSRKEIPNESKFTADIVNHFEYLRDCHYNIKHGKLGKQISGKLLKCLNNKDVDWKTKFSIMNYLRFRDYYECIKHESWRQDILYDALLDLKNMIKRKFESPDSLLNVFAKIFPPVTNYKFAKGYQRLCCKYWFLDILRFVYSKTEIYKCIESLNNTNDNAWKSIFLWAVTTCYKKDLPESQVNITDFFKTPGEFLDGFLKNYPEIDKFDAKSIKRASYNISAADLFSYHIDDIKSFIEKTDDPKKLVLLFYMIFKRDSCTAQSPLVALDIYIKLCPKIKDHLEDTNEIVRKSLSKGFETESLVKALKKTSDPEQMILLINVLNEYLRYNDIKKIFKNPKDLFDICVNKYKSKENNFEINENNCRCPEPLLKILKEYGEQKLAGFTEAFKNENDPLAKSWLLDLVNVKQNFFETYDNILDFLDKNKNYQQLQCVKNNLNRLIKKKFDAGFHRNDYCWLLGLENNYYCDTTNCDAFNYSDDIEKRCKLVFGLFLNSDYRCRTVISKWFIEPALKYHENIWKAVLGLIIYDDEHKQDIKDKDVDLWRDFNQLCSTVNDYNLYQQRYSELDSQISNLNNQINQILTLNWKWFTIIFTCIYLWRLYQLKKRLSNSSAEKNRSQPFVDRLNRAKKKRESFGLQANNCNPNKPTPLQYYEKYQARVKKLLDDMQKIIDNPEKEKILIKNENDEKNGSDINVISTINNNQEDKIGGIGD